MHGNGVFTKSDGIKYVGTFRKSMKTGRGALLWTDGRQYYGEFEENKQHGKGIMISQNGVKKYGEWLRGERERWLIFTNDPDFQALEQFMQGIQECHQSNPKVNGYQTGAAGEEESIEVRMQETVVRRGRE